MKDEKSNPAKDVTKRMTEEANNQEVVDTTNPEEGTQDDELTSILDALGKDDAVADEPEKTPESSEDPDKPFKKIGNMTFKTEAEFETWAMKQNGEVSRLTGELKKAQERLEANPSKQTAVDVNALMTQIEVKNFFNSHPDALEVKDIMAAAIRSKKAGNLAEARIIALRAIGKEVEEDGGNDTKTILKSGGGEGGMSEGSYTNNDQMKGTYDFADAALTGRI